MVGIVHLVSITKIVQIHTKQIFHMRNGTFLDMPWTVDKFSSIHHELVTEIKDMPPTEQEHVVQEENRVTKTVTNTSYEIVRYEKEICPIRPNLTFSMWAWHLDRRDEEDDNTFIDWLMGCVGRNIYVGEDGQGRYFIHPIRDKNVITMNSKVLWRY